MRHAQKQILQNYYCSYCYDYYYYITTITITIVIFAAFSITLLPALPLSTGMLMFTLRLSLMFLSCLLCPCQNKQLHSCNTSALVKDTQSGRLLL